MDTKKDKSTKKYSRRGKIERFIEKTLNFIPAKSHQQIHNVYKQQASTNSLLRSSFKDHSHRRALRNAVQSRDQNKIKGFLTKGLDIHVVISDVFLDTPLSSAVKHGYLEMVELLLRIPGCRVDHTDCYKHSVLDEAIRALLITRNHDGKKAIATRYRIIKCLLCAGATKVTVNYIDTVLFSVISTKIGRSVIQRLVRVITEHGAVEVTSTVLSVLLPYNNTITHLKTLLKNGSDPLYFARRGVRKIPVLNAILLLRYGSNDQKFLQKIHLCTSEDPKLISSQWFHFQLLFRLLVQSGVTLRTSVMSDLYYNHASLYIWITRYKAQPMPLLDICNNKARSHMKGNILQSVLQLQTIPESIKSIILLE